jgi:FkbM family methyltransferase
MGRIGFARAVLDAVAVVTAAAISMWPASESWFILVGDSLSGTTAGNAFYRRARTRLAERLRAQGRSFRMVQILGERINLDVSETPGHMAYFERRLYEEELTRLVTGLQPGDTFLDVGAHLGYFTVLAAIRVGPRGRVCAFEPNPDVRAQLTDHVARNGVADRVEISGDALSDIDGQEARLFISERGSGFSSIIPRSAPAAPSSFGRSIAVRTTTIDRWLRERGLAVTLLKIDVEGAEELVLRGMEATVASTPPRQVVCETSAGSAADVWLRGHGYRPEPLDRLPFVVGNYLYARSVGRRGESAGQTC